MSSQETLQEIIKRYNQLLKEKNKNNEWNFEPATNEDGESIIKISQKKWDAEETGESEEEIEIKEMQKTIKSHRKEKRSLNKQIKELKKEIKILKEENQKLKDDYGRFDILDIR
jgi:chromosome segregation ATPase